MALDSGEAKGTYTPSFPSSSSSGFAHLIRVVGLCRPSPSPWNKSRRRPSPWKEGHGQRCVFVCVPALDCLLDLGVRLVCVFDVDVACGFVGF